MALKPAIRGVALLHPEKPELDMITEEDFAVAEVLREVLAPFKMVQKILEGEKTVLSSKLIPMIFDLRNELVGMVNKWKAKARAPGASKVDKAVYGVLITVHGDFKERWGDTGRLHIDKEGKGRQPKVCKVEGSCCRVQGSERRPETLCERRPEDLWIMVESMRRTPEADSESHFGVDKT